MDGTRHVSPSNLMAPQKFHRFKTEALRTQAASAKHDPDADKGAPLAFHVTTDNPQKNIFFFIIYIYTQNI